MNAENDANEPPPQGPVRRIMTRWTVELHFPGYPGEGPHVLRMDKPGRTENKTGKPKGPPRRSGKLTSGPEARDKRSLTDDALAVLALAEIARGAPVQSAVRDVVARYHRIAGTRKDAASPERIERVRKIIRALNSGRGTDQS